MSETQRTLVTDDEIEQHRVLDGARELRFQGTLLASSTSETPTKSRWAEFKLYRTNSGRYVLSGIGRTTIKGESDTHWAQVSERAEAVVERLTMYDDASTRYIPSVGQRLLTEAARQDENVRRAYFTEVVD